MSTSSFKISTKLLYLSSWIVYGINIAIFFYLYSIIRQQTYFNGEYIYAGIVGGFILGSMMHVRLFKPLIWGDSLDAVSFIFAIILVPLYPATFVLYKWYEYQSTGNNLNQSPFESSYQIN